MQQLLAVAKPIVIIAESLQSSLAGQLCLLLANFRQSQVLETQVGRQVGLIVPAEQGTGFHNVVPLGKSPTPPFVILRDGVILRQI